MPVATDLQDLVADISVAIAGNRAWGRVELERLRRTASAIAEEARADARATTTARRQATNLVDAIEASVIDLSGLARRTRDRLTDLRGDDA